MANVYVRSAAAGTGTGADWTNAFTTLAAALTAKAAGDSFWVSEDHAETQAVAVTLTSPGVATNPCFIYCVNHAGTVPPVSADLRTTATISTTGANQLGFGGGTDYWQGITFSAAGGGANNASFSFASAGVHVLKNCGVVLATTHASPSFVIGTTSSNPSKIVFDNTTVQFGAATQTINFRAGEFVWKNTASAIAGATLPTTLLSGNSGGAAATVTLEAVDLSALGSGKTLVAANTSPVKFFLKDCKFGSSVTVSATQTSQGATKTLVSRCDSAATNYRAEISGGFEGSQVIETTIVRAGGASDGTTSTAWKLATTADSKWLFPFEALPIAIWNDTSGSSVTVTLFGIWGGGAVPNNDDIWMDVEYLGSALTPQGSFATSTKADNLASGSALTTDTSTWGGSTTKFKMTATFTPAQKGAIYIYVKAAKASTTFYIDPKPLLS